MSPLSDALLKRSRLLAGLVTVVLVLLIFALAVQMVAVARGRIADPTVLLGQLPVLFYLSAVWMARRAILALGGGGSDDAALAKLLRNLGLALFLGGCAAVFAVPLLLRALHGHGAIARYDAGAITLGVVGLALVVVAHLADGAAAMRRELDEIV